MLDLIKQLENEKKTNPPKVKAVSTVDVEVARKRVVSVVLGEITRRKTEDKNVVELYADGSLVGKAVAVYKTKSQRTWTVTVGEAVYEKQHTISKGLRAHDAAQAAVA